MTSSSNPYPLQGSLPFDHQDMSHLLDQVRQGKFTTPSWLPDNVKDLIEKMIQVNPEERIMVILS